MDGHFFSKKTYTEFKLFGNKDTKHPLGLERSNKQFVEEVLFEKIVNGLFQHYMKGGCLIIMTTRM